MIKLLISITLIMLMLIISGCGNKTPSVSKQFVETIKENVRQPIGPLQKVDKEMTLSVFTGESWTETFRASLTVKPTISYESIAISLIEVELEKEYSTSKLSILGPSVKIPKGYSIQFYITTPHDKWLFSIGDESYDVESLNLKNLNNIVWDFEIYNVSGEHVNYNDIYDEDGKLIDHSKTNSIPVNHGDKAKVFNGHYYNVWHIEGQVVTWEYANSLAKSHGGYLLQIDSTVDRDGNNIEAQFIYNAFCSPGEYYIMGYNSKFLGNDTQIRWNIPMSNTEYLKSWIVEYDH